MWSGAATKSARTAQLRSIPRPVSMTDEAAAACFL